MEYVINNIEWIFSGIGVFIIALVIRMFLNRKRKKTSNIRQKIKSGKKSTNIQAGRDLEIK